ncbi:MAG: T9SS type A sorting domain-containing protein [Candidatus Zophobacter franzmannii]|nr:T9SS type A sorting domain-containing protein [Candidatus Zophobacter franzmannii]
MYPEDTYEPSVAMKVKIQHNNRSMLHIYAGTSDDNDAVEPTEIKSFFCYNDDMANRNENPMNGLDDTPLEIELDISTIVNDNTKSYFLMIEEADENEEGSGYIVEYKITDYRFSEPINESYWNEWEIINDNSSTNLKINHAILPESITANLTIDYDVYIPYDTEVTSSAVLTLNPGARMHFKGGNLSITEGSLILNENAAFFFDDGAQVYISPQSSVTVGSNVYFTSNTTTGNQYFWIDGNDDDFVRFNNAHIENCRLITSKIETSIENSHFINSKLNLQSNSFDILDSDFEQNSSIQSFFVENDFPNSVCISGNSISGSELPAISLTGNKSVTIDDNEICNNGVGLDLWELNNVIIEDNSIRYNDQGVYLYHCNNLSVNGANDISENSNSYMNYLDAQGVFATHYSSWSLIGTETLPYQKIINNRRGNVYCEEFSVPYPFKYNIIHSNVDNSPYFTINELMTTTTQYYAANNYWGTNFHPLTDLTPYSHIIYNPTWNLGNTIPHIEYSIAENLYNGAITDVENEDYLLAELKFKDIIENYDSTKFAAEATKALFNLYDESNGNFTELELYLRSDPKLQSDATLLRVANYLATRCQIKLGQFQDVIDYYATIIDEPETIQDSVYATIDAGLVYLMMEYSQNKSQYVGRHSWLKPKSMSDYIENRTSLIGKLGRDDIEDDSEQPDMSSTLLFVSQNYPNPFNPSTTFSFGLSKESHVLVEIYNIRGQRVITLADQSYSKGEHTIQWDSTNNSAKPLASGVYFYRVRTNDCVTTEKCILMK